MKWSTTSIHQHDCMIKTEERQLSSFLSILSIQTQECEAVRLSNSYEWQERIRVQRLIILNEAQADYKCQSLQHREFENDLCEELNWKQSCHTSETLNTRRSCWQAWDSSWNIWASEIKISESQSFL